MLGKKSFYYDRQHLRPGYQNIASAVTHHEVAFGTDYKVAYDGSSALPAR